MIQRIHAAVSDAECARPVISIIELTHGVYRAKTEADRAGRRAFAEELARDMIVHSVSLGIAQLALAGSVLATRHAHRTDCQWSPFARMTN